MSTVDSTRELLARLPAMIEDGVAPDPATRAALGRLDDPIAVRRAGRLLAGLGALTADELRPLRITVLATCTIGAFDDLLRARLVAAGMLPAITAAPYAAFDLTLASADASAGAGDIQGADLLVCLLHDGYFLPRDWDPTDVDGLCSALRQRLDGLRELLAGAVRGSGATVVLHTVPLPAEVSDSVLSWRARAALTRAWYELNAGLLGLAAEHRQVVVCDLVGALAEQAFPAREERLHRYADLPYTDGALLALADQVRRIAQARAGLSRKVLALDLDNTLWGGVLGEVGAGGVQLGGLYPGNCYQQLQLAASRLREQGVILVLASKNDPRPVARTLAEHPAALLGPDAFSVTAVNWAPKPENLRAAATSLGLATGSFVFMDDSPFERGQVAAELPQVALVAADGDPAYLVRALLRPGFFDAVELTEADRDRPRLYRTRAVRSEFAGGFASSSDYLRALDIEVTAEPVTEYTVARVAQLAARTNQFNVTGCRFDEAATAAMAADPRCLVASFAVADRFGDEGVVGAVWLRPGGDGCCTAHRQAPGWTVGNLVLSCRVLGRGVELAMVGWIAGRARAGGRTQLCGRFVPGRANAVASGLWTEAGFGAVAGENGLFTLAVGDEFDCTPPWIRLRERTGAHR